MSAIHRLRQGFSRVHDVLLRYIPNEDARTYPYSLRNPWKSCIPILSQTVQVHAALSQVSDPPQPHYYPYRVIGNTSISFGEDILASDTSMYTFSNSELQSFTMTELIPTSLETALWLISYPDLPAMISRNK